VHLLLEHLRIFQPSRRRNVQQFLVRNAAPDEERQPRCELDVADAIRRAGSDARGITLDAEQELRADEQSLDRPLDAEIEAALLGPSASIGL